MLSLRDSLRYSLFPGLASWANEFRPFGALNSLVVSRIEFFAYFFLAARFSLAHPSFTIWRPRAIASESSGTSSVMHDAAAT